MNPELQRNEPEDATGHQLTSFLFIFRFLAVQSA